MTHDAEHAARAIAASPSEPLHARIATLVPGVALSGLIAAAALVLRSFSGLAMLSPMIVAIALGALLHNAIGTPAAAKPGIAFSVRWILRLAIVMLGFQVTMQQVLDVGPAGLAIIGMSLLLCFIVTKPLGSVLGVDTKLTELIAAGTSICGASAVIATNTVTKAPEEDAAYAVACVTFCGMVVMVLYPLLLPVLGLNARDYGLWTGASVHEVAQVVAASYQAGTEAGDYATITKLTRVIMLAPMIMTLGALAARTRGDSGEGRYVPLPYFALVFIAVVGLNSWIEIAPSLNGLITGTTGFLLALSLAAMGLATDMKKLALKGGRPLLLGALSSLFISALSLILVKLFA
jgi:uncharacterized integral membrane protein (TIGR00698 family)